MPIDFSSIPKAQPLGGATKMMAAALERARARGVTQRHVAEQLGYASSVVISHMASGRVPIPVERVHEIAEAVGLDPQSFLLAVLEQRFPSVDVRSLLGAQLVSHGRVAERLGLLAGSNLDDLNEETLGVLDEVVSASQPRSRWLSLEELALVEALRRRFPDLSRRPLSADELSRLDGCLQSSPANRSSAPAATRNQQSN